MNFKNGDHEITESQLLDHTLELLENQGAEIARDYLESHHQGVRSTNRVQIENFRYCLAAVCGEKDTALHILHDAIMEEGYWYRPEVFEDEDLKSLWEEPVFIQLRELSSIRYQKVLDESVPVCTWKEKEGDTILLALHGNQETLEDAKKQWEFMNSTETQVEYFQSGEPDSYGIYRWEADGPGAQQLSGTLNKMEWETYHDQILTGFSAGCNVIARGISEETVHCSKMIFVAPWLPSFDTIGYDSLCEPLKDTKVLIVCGEQDNDCLSSATELAHILKIHGIASTLNVIPQLGHGFPDNFAEIVQQWL